jgi:hypothetical protein
MKDVTIEARKAIHCLALELDAKVHADARAKIEPALFDSLFGLICDHLPEDWLVTFECSHGEMAVILDTPDGDEVEFVDDDCDLREMVVNRVNHARTSDGLLPIEAAIKETP